MNKIIGIPLFSIYLLIVIFMTVYVLNINKYNTSKIGSLTFIIEKSNDLIVINKKKNINVNDNIYYYDIYNQNNNISNQKVVKKEIIDKNNTVYTLEDKHLLSDIYLIGNSKVLSLPIIGGLIKILSSTLGYLIFIVIPILFALIYFTHKLRMEIRNQS